MILKKDYSLYPVFFESCRIVEGGKNSIICDIQRGKYLSFPKNYNSILKRFQGKNIKTILDENCENIDSLIEIINMLVEKEYLFLTRHPENFPSLSLDWYHYAIISNALIDYSKKYADQFDHLKNQLIELECQNIKVRSFGKIEYFELINIIKCFENDFNVFFELLLPISEDFIIEDIVKLCEEVLNLNRIVLYNSKDNKRIIFDVIDGRSIFLSKEKITQNSCGIVNPGYFTNDISHFTEAHHHNTCLNCKISIDAEGNIRNCPSMPQSFGNIKDTTLQQALDHPDFKKYWNHKKDDIEVCKDCEFRYICTDCRAYLEDPHNEYSKPLKCGYDPYAGGWSEWSTNPLKKAAIKYYGMEGMVKGNAKILK